MVDVLHFSGFIELAADADRLEEYRRISAINRKHGVDVHEISPQEVQKLFPLCRKSQYHTKMHQFLSQLTIFLRLCMFLQQVSTTFRPDSTSRKMVA